MGGEVVHHYYLTTTQCGRKDSLHISLEDRSSGSSLYGKRWSHTLHRHARKYSRVLAPVTRHRAVSSLPFERPGPKRSKGGVGAHLVDEHQLLWIDLLGEHYSPSSSQPLVSFQRPHSPFFRLKPIRLRSLLRVGSLRDLPAKLSKKWRLSATVAAGLLRISSSRSLFVASSALGGLPPPFLGARDSH